MPHRRPYRKRHRGGRVYCCNMGGVLKIFLFIFIAPILDFLARWFYHRYHLDFRNRPLPNQTPFLETAARLRHVRLHRSRHQRRPENDGDHRPCALRRNVSGSFKTGKSDDWSGHQARAPGHLRVQASSPGAHRSEKCILAQGRSASPRHPRLGIALHRGQYALHRLLRPTSRVRDYGGKVLSLSPARPTANDEARLPASGQDPRSGGNLLPLLAAGSELQRKDYRRAPMPEPTTTRRITIDPITRLEATARSTYSSTTRACRARLLPVPELRGFEKFAGPAAEDMRRSLRASGRLPHRAPTWPRLRR